MTNNISNQPIIINKLTIKILVTILFLSTLTILLLKFRPEFKGSIDWQSLNDANLLSELAILIFISLAIQSSIEIFISNFREVTKLELQQAINFLETKADKDNNEEEELARKQKKLKQYRSQTKKITNFAGLFLGFIVGLSGVRILQPFVQELNLIKWQEILFHTIDILLVAGLLSGGSSGIHRITRIYNEFTNLTREKVKK